jgi:proline iminopeptidase
LSPPQITRSTETVTVNDVQLFTRTVGDGPDVVVLHGGPGAQHDYLLPQFDGLATGRTLRYYDQRGGGQSPVSRDVPVGWREQVADLDGLIGHWGLDPVTILGYSWGGLLALLYATEHPDRVERLALASPAPATASGRTVFGERFAERSSAPEIVEEREQLRASGLRESDPAAYKQRLFELSVAGYFADSARARDLTPFRITGKTQTEVWESLGDYDLCDQLSGVTITSMVAHGRHDPIPLSTAEETATLLDAPITIFEESGHVPYVEEYDRFIHVIDAFLPKAP